MTPAGAVLNGEAVKAAPLRPRQFGVAYLRRGGPADEVPSPDRRAAALTPREKLAEVLRDLADKVVKEGRNGHLTVGAIRVVSYRVDVMVFLNDLTPATLEKLRQLGFEQSAESRATRLLIGRIDVRKLADLAALESVILVRPVAEG